MPTPWPGEPTIIVLAEEDPVVIGFDALAAYHGQSALAMLAIVFQGLRHVLHRVSPAAPARRADISIVSGHPGPGVRDAFEFVTRAVTRNAYVVDRGLKDAQLSPFSDVSYSFHLTLGIDTASAILRDSILPPRFFELGSAKQRSAEQAAEYSALKRTIALDVLRREPGDIFDVH